MFDHWHASALRSMVSSAKKSLISVLGSGLDVFVNMTSGVCATWMTFCPCTPVMFAASSEENRNSCPEKMVACASRAVGETARLCG